MHPVATHPWFRQVRCFGLAALLAWQCAPRNTADHDTHITIAGDQWQINDRRTHPGTPAEGLLLNVRMVNAVFEDRNDTLPNVLEGFDPEKNTDAFIRAIPGYAAAGINAFTVCLQGGLPGYEGAVNTAFTPDGGLREEYMKRIERVIRACNQHNMAVIVSCLYQRQRDHRYALTGKQAIRSAVANTAHWLKEHAFENVMLEIANEYRHGGFRRWPDGEWLISDTGQAELILLAKEIHPRIPVSTSGMGNGAYPDTLAKIADYITIHFNNTEIDAYPGKIRDLVQYNKPVVCNEDNKTGSTGAKALSIAVENRCSWGYMNSAVNQYAPFRFDGPEDDPEVYRVFMELSGQTSNK